MREGKAAKEKFFSDRAMQSSSALIVVWCPITMLASLGATSRYSGVLGELGPDLARLMEYLPLLFIVSHVIIAIFLYQIKSTLRKGAVMIGMVAITALCVTAPRVIYEQYVEEMVLPINDFVPLEPVEQWEDEFNMKIKQMGMGNGITLLYRKGVDSTSLKEVAMEYSNEKKH